jgi:hypothetical protein
MSNSDEIQSVSIFFDANEKNIDRFYKSYKTKLCTRIILKCDYTHSKDMLKKLDWLSIT